jgi:hypothetical protein
MATKLSSALKYQHYARISGNDAAELMNALRYDRACPFQEVDASILHRAISQPGEVALWTAVVTKYSDGMGGTHWHYDLWGTIDVCPIDLGEAYSTERKVVRYDQLSKIPVDATT